MAAGIASAAGIVIVNRKGASKCGVLIRASAALPAIWGRVALPVTTGEHGALQPLPPGVAPIGH